MYNLDYSTPAPKQQHMQGSYRAELTKFYAFSRALQDPTPTPTPQKKKIQGPNSEQIWLELPSSLHRLTL